MSLNTDYIKLIFGLKLKQLRNEKKFSLADLSQKSGLSVSYINEIEKGKKYPKADKISLLAEALEVDYDQIVSLQLSKKLAPISVLLKSNFLTEVPFDFFGIDTANLLEMLANAPTKLSAFINTIIKIANSYNMSVEQFYFAMLRSYQEMHDNYFPELEKFADTFFEENQLNADVQVDEFYLSNFLLTRYGISIEYFDEKSHPVFGSVRSIYIQKSKKVLINKRISSDQRAFTLAREVGFLYMNLKIRPKTSSWIQVNSFDEVFNNFQASYFAGAILIRKNDIIENVNRFLSAPVFDETFIENMIERFQTTPETLIQRIFSLLPQFHGIERIFFLRFEAPKGSKEYSLTKEMHLAKQHNPQESKSENYCRRWISLNILDELAIKQSQGFEGSLVRSQISNYEDADNQYLVISIAKPLHILENVNVSISLGIELDTTTKKKINFIEKSSIPERKVNQTCEKCSIFDCNDRIAAPIILQRKRLNSEIKQALEKLI
jgi:XRE family transcriptional regulator, fatty acid utilization regulator